jgi:hypothetical protein
MVVRVETDMPQGPAGTLTTVRVVVRPRDETVPRFDRAVDLGVPTDVGVVTLPADLVTVLPRNDDPTRVEVVEVTALQGVTPLFTHRAIAGFVAGHTVVLEVYLADQCRTLARSCPSGTTCGRTGCEPELRPSLPDRDATSGDGR